MDLMMHCILQQDSWRLSLKVISHALRLFDEFPVNLSTPEININFEKHGQQFEAMDSLSSHIDFPGASVNTIDGVQSGL